MAHDGTSGVEAVELPEGTLVRMWGSVDESLRSQASAVMAHALGRTGPVVVDADDVEFLDSSGLAFILQMLLRDPPVLLLEMLELLGLRDEVPLVFSAT
ncbi:MAG TPA: anti-sigma factor antagonist [Actinotalea sp.]|nr:anti-sigma factor antagonist [Actinotalea sp.]